MISRTVGSSDSSRRPLIGRAYPLSARGSTQVEAGDSGEDGAVSARTAQIRNRRSGAVGEQADPNRRLLVVGEVAQVVVLAPASRSSSRSIRSSSSTVSAPIGREIGRVDQRRLIRRRPRVGRRGDQGVGRHRGARPRPPAPTRDIPARTPAGVAHASSSSAPARAAACVWLCPSPQRVGGCAGAAAARARRPAVARTASWQAATRASR